MTNTSNFADIPKEYSHIDRAKIVIIPVPYDQTSTWIKGADKGPDAIIAASANLELYDIETDTEVYKKGVYTDKVVQVGSSPQQMVEKVEQRVRCHLGNDKFVAVLGGEHSVSIGAVRAHAEKNQKMTVLQLDAHADLREEYNGSKYNHACVMARIRELCPVIQVGIRSMDASEKIYLDPAKVFFAKDIYSQTNWINMAVSKLSEKVYLTIDLDVFDPSIMPSTGTPEPGGLLWYEALSLLRTVFEQRDVIGFDVVELCPNENNKAPDFLAAKLVYKLLSYKFRG
jgi:agmatinase